MLEIFSKYKKEIGVAVAVTGVAIFLQAPTHESTTFKDGALPNPIPTRIVNPRLEALASCQPPGKYGEKRLPWHIRLIIKGIGIDTGSDGVWTVIKNLSTGSSAVTSYTGNNQTAIYNGENHEGFINIIRGSQGESKRSWISTNTPYNVQVIEGVYTEWYPILGKVVAEKNIITPRCP